MNSSGELHPNWLALTTLPLQLKRFVRAGDPDSVPESPKAVKHQLNGLNGAEAQEFYKEVLDAPTTSQVPPLSSSKTKETKVVPKKPKLPFDKSKFFRLATSNQVEELSQMEIYEEDLNSRDTFGWTALMMAACEGATETVAWLLQKGVHVETADKSGNTALKLAQRKGHSEVVQLLQSRPISAEGSDGEESVDINSPFYCEICKRDYKETPWPDHQTSTVHQFNLKALPAHKLHKFNISAKNRGLQLMVKQGWDQEHGLGPSKSGRLYPVKTVLRKQRTGLGIEQQPARVTHFGAYDLNAVRRRDPIYQQRRTRSDMQREKVQEWKRERHLRRELS
ncbi:G patch domain and ankyrin repeat-containing protein 1 homolog [Drosophila subpulchrella]|uniref:G patch domain and ankyrin repeat-containing protein 1 homolog n=1 Tax=Drosophila subpulchrella TaxID=1486046 RepID=UPI0018A17C23|nr:G patch domain and ankyrin repeat-containing protein 1 homolog [Drosophila subpulchrella]